MNKIKELLLVAKAPDMYLSDHYPVTADIVAAK